MPARPFHLAFAVADLGATRRFYRDVLGCGEGRSAATWVDFDFWGNQISAHLYGPGGKPGAAQAFGHVDGVEVPIPHLGAILGWDEFQELAGRLRAAEIAFVIAPQVRYVGQPGEQATMFFLDPSGNAIEIKAYKHPEHVYTS